MNYEETLEYMLKHLPMFHRIGKAAYRANLSTALLLDDYFNHPHKHYKTIHIAGTNGKGSVAHTLSAILQTAGYKTGLFTSPHLKDFRERIRINGQMISQKDVVFFIEQFQEIFKNTSPSFFEMTSALAFYYFSEMKVDIAIIEVGMGGRLDSTNIITPLLSVITNIGMDHTEFLGDTFEKIAREKAGIIKSGVPVVIGEYNPVTWPVFQQMSSDLGAKALIADKLYKVDESQNISLGKQVLNVYRNNQLQYEDLSLDLNGLYQRKNICTVLAAAEILNNLDFKINTTHLYEAVNNVQEMTGFRGRWQRLSEKPLIICDTGHNTDGIKMTMDQLKSVYYNKLHMVIGFVNDKDINGMLELLPKNAGYYFTKADIPRALNENELRSKALQYSLFGDSYSTVKSAFEAAQAAADKEDLIYVGGSNFVVAEVI